MGVQCAQVVRRIIHDTAWGTATATFQMPRGLCGSAADPCAKRATCWLLFMCFKQMIETTGSNLAASQKDVQVAKGEEIADGQAQIDTKPTQTRS